MAVQKRVDGKMTPDGVFAALNTASFSWFHVNAILISGVGFFTDAYDLYSVGIITPMIAYARFPEHLKGGKYGSLPTNYDLVVKGIALVGTLFGQIFFGVIGDKLGRKGAYGWTLIIMIITTLGCAAASWGDQATFIGVFCMWRFLLGIGIGGDYPLSAVITSEYTPQHIRGSMMAAVFSMQGIGYMAATIVSTIVLACFQSSISECVPGVACDPLDKVWRIIVAIGVVPAIATFYLRTRLPETPRYTVHVNQDFTKAEGDVTSVLANDNTFKQYEKNNNIKGEGDRITWRDFHNYITQRKNMLVLFGTCSTWFFLDIAYYCNNLFTPKVVGDIGYSVGVTPKSVAPAIYDNVFKNTTGSAIVIIIGLVPGYFFTIAFIEKMGRKLISYMGFIMMTILLVIVSAAYNPLRNDAIWAFIVLYALTFFFANFGPNTTTFIVPGECFPTKYRSTAHGISAACGKVGAIVGVYGFGHLSDTQGTQITLGMLSIFMFVGTLCTYFVPETKGLTLEDLNDEPIGRTGAADTDIKAPAVDAPVRA